MCPCQPSHEEELRRKAKREERYKELLLEYYWRSDHIGTSWEEEAKDQLSRCVCLSQSFRLLRCCVLGMCRWSVDCPWTDALTRKYVMYMNANRHSAYRDLDPEDRKRLFDEHMAGLQAKMQKKVGGWMIWWLAGS